MWINCSIVASILTLFCMSIIWLDGVMGLTMRILEWTCKDNLQCCSCNFFVLEIELKRVYNQRVFSKVIFCRGSENHSLEWEATRATWELLSLLMRKSLLDFSWSRLKKRLFNKFYLGSFFAVSHAWYMFWTLVLTEHIVDIYKDSHQRVVRGDLFTFCMYITSLPWSTSYPKSVLLSIMNHFHIHCTLKLLFRLRIKNTFLRQQIWKTKAYAQYLYCCKTFFCEEKNTKSGVVGFMRSLFVILLFTLIKQGNCEVWNATIKPKRHYFVGWGAENTLQVVLNSSGNKTVSKILRWLYSFKIPLKELFHANSLLTFLISKSVLLQVSSFSECYSCVQVKEIEFIDTPKNTSHYLLQVINMPSEDQLSAYFYASCK